MADSLEDFLGTKNKEDLTIVNGSLSCQQCDEKVNTGILDENTMLLTYRCSKNHQSKVKL